VGWKRNFTRSRPDSSLSI